MSVSGDAVQPMAVHFAELKWRLLIVSAVLLTVSTLAYVFRDALLTVLTLPLGERELISLTPAGGFAFIFNVSIFTGAAVAFPFFIYHLYAFLAPVMKYKTRGTALKIVTVSTLLMTAGMVYAYFFAIPGALKFLYEFPGAYVDMSMLTADSYLMFVVKYMAGVGLAFQIPVIIIIIHWLRPLTMAGLLRSERWVIVGAFIAAAFITPTPDPLNQSIIALPIILVYQGGVIAVWVSLRRARGQEPLSSAVRDMPVVDLAPSSTAPPSETNQHSSEVAVRKSVRKRSIDGIATVSRTSSKPSKSVKSERTSV